jgi:Tfp pilus assembly protein PilO
MGGAKRSTWIGGTVFAALVIMAATYFLAVSPMLATASDTRAEVVATQQSNDALQRKITKLAADFAKLPEYKADLAAVRVQIPVGADLSGYLRQLDAIAVAHSVTLTTLGPSVAQKVVPAVSAAAPAAAVPTPAPTAESSAADATATGRLSGHRRRWPGPTASAPAAPATDATGTGAAAAPAANAAPVGFAAIPFTMTVVGTYDNGLAFLSDLQNATPRLFLVTALTETSQSKTDAGGGRPATALGDIELTVTGFTYALTDPYAVPAAAAPAAAAPALPGAVAGKNPLVPLGGK